MSANNLYADSSAKPIPGSADQFTAAVRCLETAKAEHRVALKDIEISEQRMRDIQSEAEEMQLSLVMATAEADAVRNVIQSLVAQENSKRTSYQEALDILSQAQEMVEETKRDLESVENARIEEEIKMPSVCLKEATAKIAFHKHLGLAELESAKSRSILAESERKLVQSKIAVADVQLGLLASPDVLDCWPRVQEAIAFDGGDSDAF